MVLVLGHEVAFGEVVRSAIPPARVRQDHTDGPAFLDAVGIRATVQERDAVVVHFVRFAGRVNLGGQLYGCGVREIGQDASQSFGQILVRVRLDNQHGNRRPCRVEQIPVLDEKAGVPVILQTPLERSANARWLGSNELLTVCVLPGHANRHAEARVEQVFVHVVEVAAPMRAAGVVPRGAGDAFPDEDAHHVFRQAHGGLVLGRYQPDHAERVTAPAHFEKRRMAVLHPFVGGVNGAVAEHNHSMRAEIEVVPALIAGDYAETLVEYRDGALDVRRKRDGIQVVLALPVQQDCAELDALDAFEQRDLLHDAAQFAHRVPRAQRDAGQPLLDLDLRGGVAREHPQARGVELVLRLVTIRYLLEDSELIAGTA